MKSFKALTERLVTICAESDLSPTHQLAALSKAQARLRKFHAPVSPRGLQKPKSFKPLARPSGNMMGKQKREAKSE